MRRRFLAYLALAAALIYAGQWRPSWGPGLGLPGLRDRLQGTSGTGSGSPLLYQPATSAVPQGRHLVTLHFAAPGGGPLVPVTRDLPRGRTPVADSLRELLRGPAAGAGLDRSVPALEWKRLLLSGGTLTIDLTEPVAAAMSGWGSAGGTMALDAIVLTAGSHPSVERVRFTVEGKAVPALFHGLDVTEPFPARPPLGGTGFVTAYLGLATQAGRGYVVPATVPAAASTTEQAARAALAVLQRVPTAPELARLFAPVPSDVRLMSTRLDGGHLVARFNSALLAAYRNDPGRRALMADALLLTLTALPGVQTVEIVADDSTTLDTLGHLSIGKRLSRPLFLNPE